MRGVRFILLGLFVLSVIFMATYVSAEGMLAGQTCSADVEDYDEHNLVLFYWYTCPHCHDEIRFIEEEVSEVYPDLDVHIFETKRSENEKNRELFASFAENFNSSDQGVPRTFINGKVFVGFDDGNGSLTYNPAYKAYIGYKNQIIEEIEKVAQAEGFEKKGHWTHEEPSSHTGSLSNVPLWPFLIFLFYLPTYIFLRKWIHKSSQNRRYWFSGLVASFIVSFFFFIVTIPEAAISNFASGMPFGLFVVILALADGFNPCAFTVLFILLSLLTYTRVKKTMFHIGNAFVITSAVMYFIFIMLMVLVGGAAISAYGETILKVLGIIILIAGTINLKDYIFFKKGVSLTLSSKETSKITHKARKIVQNLNENKTRKGFLIALGSTILLAIGVNVVELGCSAILPAVYMASLIGNYGSTIGTGHILWTALYALVYIIPLYAILFNFIFTFRSDRINEKQGRVLKLVAGLFMFVCGIIMVLKPTLLMS